MNEHSTNGADNLLAETLTKVESDPLYAAIAAYARSQSEQDLRTFAEHLIGRCTEMAASAVIGLLRASGHGNAE